MQMSPAHESSQGSSWRISVGRVATAVLALGALLAWGLAPGTAGAATGPRSARTVSIAQNSELGTILVAGNTVYTVKPSATACTAACLKAWPPVLLPRGATTPTAGTGVDGSKLGTAAAAHGARQITYSGKRLYWFAKDTARGQVHGVTKNKWGKWSTVAAATIAPTTAPPATEAPSTAPPATDAPATAPPVTEAPATEPPATEGPAPQPTEPPAPKTTPPTSPGTGGVAF
jgi:predicted lipoprotein with Yx(FWY)xxD motif